MRNLIKTTLAALIPLSSFACHHSAPQVNFTSPTNQPLEVESSPPVGFQRCYLRTTHDEERNKDEIWIIKDLRVVNSAEFSSFKDILNKSETLEYYAWLEVTDLNNWNRKTITPLPFEYVPHTRFYLEGPLVCRRVVSAISGYYGHLGLVCKYNPKTKETEWFGAPPPEKKSDPQFPGWLRLFGPPVE